MVGVSHLVDDDDRGVQDIDLTDAVPSGWKRYDATAPMGSDDRVVWAAAGTETTPNVAVRELDDDGYVVSDNPGCRDDRYTLGIKTLQKATCGRIRRSPDGRTALRRTGPITQFGREWMRSTTGSTENVANRCHPRFSFLLVTPLE